MLLHFLGYPDSQSPLPNQLANHKQAGTAVFALYSPHAYFDPLPTAKLLFSKDCALARPDLHLNTCTLLRNSEISQGVPVFTRGELRTGRTPHE